MYYLLKKYFIYLLLLSIPIKIILMYHVFLLFVSLLFLWTYFRNRFDYFITFLNVMISHKVY